MVLETVGVFVRPILGVCDGAAVGLYDIIGLAVGALVGVCWYVGV